MTLYINDVFFNKNKVPVFRNYCKSSLIMFGGEKHSAGSTKDVGTQTQDTVNSGIKAFLNEKISSEEVTPSEEKFSKLVSKLLESNNKKSGLIKDSSNLGPDLDSPVVSNKSEPSSDKLVESAERLLESSTKVGDLCKKPSSLEPTLIVEYYEQALDAKKLAEVAERLLDSSNRAEAISNKYAKLHDGKSNSFSESSSVWQESSDSESYVESGSESSVHGKVQSSNCDSPLDSGVDFSSFINFFEVFDFLLLHKYSVAVTILGLLSLSYKSIYKYFKKNLD